MTDKPLLLRGNASLARSKPGAGPLVPRGPLWASSARSTRVPASPFSMLPRYARRYHRGWLASLATAIRFFFPDWANAHTDESLHTAKEFNHFRDLTKMIVHIDTHR